MPVIIFETKDEIPEHLRSKAKETDGKWELDASGVLNKNTELLEKNKTLTETNQELTASVARLESSVLPDGKVPVDPEIEKLGLAAKKAELKPSDIPALKTKADELQSSLDKVTSGLVLDAAQKARNFNERFKKMFADKGVKLEETDDGDFNVIGEGGTKTKLDDFLTSDEYFKDFADTFKADKPTKRFAAQFPDSKGAPAANKFDAIRESKKEEQQSRSAFATASVADKFYGRVAQEG